MALEPGVYDVRFRKFGRVFGSGQLALETTLADESVSGAFNVAKGAAAGLVDAHPNALVALLLRIQAADDVMEDLDTVADLLAGDATEADFTNYARKTGLAGVTEVDDECNKVKLSVSTLTWENAGGATNNSLVKLVIAIQTGADDTTLIPLTHHNFKILTNGSAIQADFHAEGFYKIE